MSYLFITYSDDSRDLAEHAQNHLAAAGISTWLRDIHLDRHHPADKQILDTVLYKATALLVVWRLTAATSSGHSRQLLQEIKEARERGQPVLLLGDESQLPNLITEIAMLVPRQRDLSPLPMPMDGSDATEIGAFVDDMRRPSSLTLVSLIVGVVGAIVLVSVIFLLQSPGGLLNPPTVTPSQTSTATLVLTATRTLFPSATATDTLTITYTSTYTLTVLSPPTRATLQPTMTLADTSIQQPRPPASKAEMPLIPQVSVLPMFTNTPRTQDQSQG